MPLNEDDIRRLMHESKVEQSEAGAHALGRQVAAFLAGLRSGSVFLSEEHAADLARDYLSSLFDLVKAQMRPPDERPL